MAARYAELRARVRAAHLDLFGGFHPVPDDDAPPGAGTLLLLGPHEPGFWAHVTAAPEFSDAAPNPLDRWSARVLAALAADLGAVALFPFGGPPYRPFIAWALRTGRAWQSPAGLLVHDTAGLMVSYRGALALPERIALPPAPACPCDTCPDKPCLTACPVNALSARTGYDVAACHGFLDTPPGADCMGDGCRARRACPVSRGHARLGEQSAFHMRAFHP